MGNNAYDNLKVQYEEGARLVRHWIECRYKILQFVGYLNAAVLTFGFVQGIILSKEYVVAGVSICALSVIVALMGLATEFSTATYIGAYFEVLRKIEDQLAPEIPGAAKWGKKIADKDFFHKWLPVHRAHKFFYFALMVFWTTMLVSHARL